MKMCSLQKNPGFCLTIILLIIKGWCLWCFCTWFFFGVKFCFQCQFFSKMPQMHFDGFLVIKFGFFFGEQSLHSTFYHLIGSQKLEGSLNVIFIFYFYQKLAKSCYEWSLGVTRNLYNSKLIAQFTLLSL
jgi:hypothetical protein